ncbi:coiled-coil domain-containing protein 192 isoform X4 [Mesocricetus auratus]|uniref:Coiled-coil domain-containing protein 192 isoform X4 n=1 Tax=Mesocricetus auratus TaxID=10036 RepID=A0ABM2X4A8_MESAU|nr:coiled-coil domain-containing protein 192 isoform X4 [Mesocricetus auratus]
MGVCHSKKVVIPDFETSARCRSTCSSMFGRYPSDIRPQNRTWEDSPVGRQKAAFTLEQLENLEICLKEAEEKAKALLEQLLASEEAKSQLLKKVSLLEERLEVVDQKRNSEQFYENMVLEKDKCIKKLQAEVKASQEKLTAHKLKHKMTVKKLQTDLAVAKQEAAITVLELNEKMKTLCEGRPFPGGATWEQMEEEEVGDEVASERGHSQHPDYMVSVPHILSGSSSDATEFLKQKHLWNGVICV